MRSLRKTKSKRNYRQMGGDGQGSRGHGYSFPIEYYGGNSKRYFPAGSPELVPEDSAYGKTVATGFGKDVESLEGENMTGPDLAPFPRTSGVQTGGRKKRGLRKRKSLKKKGGSVMGNLMMEASNLVVPVGLLAARKYLKKRGHSKMHKRNMSRRNKSKRNKSKRNKSKRK